MKKYCSLLLTLCFLFCIAKTTFACECSPTTFVPCQKTYITPTQVIFSENEIFVHIDDMAFRTSTIYSDAQGLYFQDAERECGFLQSPCPRFGCPGCNFPWDSRCHVCDKKLK